MAVVPAVYVSVQDKSFISDSLSVNSRSGFMAIYSDRGEHNTVVRISSVSELYRKYGNPDFEKFGQSHYLATKYLQNSNQLYVVRPVLFDGTVDSAAISNIGIRFNGNVVSNRTDNGTIAGVYNFINLTDATTDGFANSGGFVAQSKRVYSDALGYQQFNIGDYIFNGGEGDTNGSAVKITGKTYDSDNDLYYFTLESSYAGTSTSNGGVGIGRANGAALDDPPIFSGTQLVDGFDQYAAYQVFVGVRTVVQNYTFTNASNVVVAATVNGFNAISVEDWIYPVAGNFAFARQVIAKEDNTGTGGNLDLILDDVWADTTATLVNLKIYVPFEVDSTAYASSESSFIDAPHVLWDFYHIGAGSIGNKYYIQGNRNISFEKLFTDDDGNPEYKYNFVDLTLYRRNQNGSSTIVEGPFTVSLMQRTPDGQVIRDISTGNELYIETVFNTRSNYIRVKSGLGANETMIHSLTAEQNRLYIMSMFANGSISRLNTLGQEGIDFINGLDGVMFDENNRFNYTNPKIDGLIASVYNGGMVSEDGSVESIVQSIYPAYVFDYVISGGYSDTVQNAARVLVDTREDCMLLGDTFTLASGYANSAATDVVRRATTYNWNTPNAMLYTQARRITDTFTGKQFYVSPVYDAIERHLIIDNTAFVSEPVAGISKGNISSVDKLLYRATLTQLEDMLDVELNPTVIEPDGTYFVSQFTTWKRLSILKRAHAVKFTHFIRKGLSSVLKPFLQQLGTPQAVNAVEARSRAYMVPFVVSGVGARTESIKSFDISVSFDDIRSELYVTLEIFPLRAIESIYLNIVVR